MEEDDAYIVVNSIIENYTPTVLKGIDMILESNLTDYQKKVAQQIYIYSKEYVATILHKDTDNTVKIIEMVCHIMKQVEIIDKTTGNDKKIIAPNKWFADTSFIKEWEDIYDKNWIRI